jgi:hypothetical protein
MSTLSVEPKKKEGPKASRNRGNGTQKTINGATIITKPLEAI